MVNVAGRVGIGAFNVSGENDGQIVAHILSKLDDALGFLGKLGKFFVRIFGVIPVVIKSLFVGESVIEPVDGDNANVLIVVVGRNFLDGVEDFIESVDREKIFPFRVISFFEPAPGQRAFAIDIKDNGCVWIERLEGERLTGGRLPVNKDRSCH